MSMAQEGAPQSLATALRLAYTFARNSGAPSFIRERDSNQEVGMRHGRVAVAALVCLMAANLCPGQQLSKKMSNQDVIDMVSLGLSDDVVMDKIHGGGEKSGSGRGQPENHAPMRKGGYRAGKRLGMQYGRNGNPRRSPH